MLFQNCTITVVKYSLWFRIKLWMLRMVVRLFGRENVFIGCKFEEANAWWPEGTYKTTITSFGSEEENPRA